jgi:hypothetical protein
MGEVRCSHLTARRTDPSEGPQHQCALVAQIAGVTDAWITDKYLGACAGDDGSSSCSLTINSLLRLRVVALWDRPDPDDCVGTLSVAQAFALLLSRCGKTAGKTVLEDAVAAGMPLTQAKALAAANGIPPPARRAAHR